MTETEKFTALTLEDAEQLVRRGIAGPSNIRMTLNPHKQQHPTSKRETL